MIFREGLFENICRYLLRICASKLFRFGRLLIMLCSYLVSISIPSFLNKKQRIKNSVLDILAIIPKTRLITIMLQPNYFYVVLL